MKRQEASNSAAIIAAHGAFDSAKPAAERICYDPYAKQFAGPGFTVIGEVVYPFFKPPANWIRNFYHERIYAICFDDSSFSL